MYSKTTPLTRLKRGTRLGKYRLEALLAEGGFSQVWRARDTLEGQGVALKIPHGLRRGSAEEEEFLEEIRLSARLDHPNILRIRNADLIDGQYVIASDLAIESLEQRMYRRIGVRLALSFTRQILEGLAYAHRQRVLHRDLKPSNLIIYPGDNIRIADFGLAKVMKHSMVSATGSGTLLYIAPEQAHGYPCFASDVFSLGLILHQLFTGKLPRWPFHWPFEGGQVLEAKVPAEVVRIVRKATQVNHRNRYHDAIEMLAAFERVQPVLRKFLQPRARPSTRQRRRRRLGAWRDLRFREFLRAFGKRLRLRFECPDCRGPISEHMACCPWCGLDSLSFAEVTEFDHYCARCERGLRDEWRFCPWCWGPGFPGADGLVRNDSRYETLCEACEEPMIEGMLYCPWCHAKRSGPVEIEELADTCGHCGSSVITDFWSHCPWCAHALERSTTRR